MALGPVQEFAYWQHGASARVKGQGSDHNPYPPATQASNVWHAGWKAWGDYLLRSGAALGARFRYGVVWWNSGFWNWQDCCLDVGVMARPLFVADFKEPPNSRTRGTSLREAVRKHHLPGLDLDAVAILRVPDDGRL